MEVVLAQQLKAIDRGAMEATFAGLHLFKIGGSVSTFAYSLVHGIKSTFHADFVPQVLVMQASALGSVGDLNESMNVHCHQTSS